MARPSPVGPTEDGTSMARLKRALYVAAGTIFVGLAVVGIVLPLLPTTPFLLLAAYCYARGSERMYRWLVTNRVFGQYLNDYWEGRGMTARAKAISIGSLWATILLCIWFFIDIWWVQLLLVVIASGVTYHLLTIPTKR